MSHASEAELEGRYTHAAVQHKNWILIIGGRDRLNNRQASHYEIWMYNLYTGHWRKYVMDRWRKAPAATYWSCAVVIRPDVYMFGGWLVANTNRSTNALWKLTTGSNGNFTWRKIEFRDDKNTPSPRAAVSGWEYDDKLWLFGGVGTSFDGYLSDYGDFCECSLGVYINNQLLCFNPSCEGWMNLESTGTVPTPRAWHASAVIQDKAYLYGGGDAINKSIAELYELNMHSLTWTQIYSDLLQPQGRYFCSLTALSDEELVLHGGMNSTDELRDTWIIDLPSRMWMKHTPHDSINDHPRYGHTGTLDSNGRVVIIGGCKTPKNKDAYKTIFHITLKFKPKSLQQLALKTVYEHRADLSFNRIPPTLMTALGNLEEDIEKRSGRRNLND